MQFGSADLTVSIKKHLFPKQFQDDPASEDSASSTDQQEIHPYRSTPTTRILDSMKYATYRVLQIPPRFGGTQVYMQAIGDICSSLREAAIETIVLSPFPHGERISNM